MSARAATFSASSPSMPAPSRQRSGTARTSSSHIYRSEVGRMTLTSTQALPQLMWSPEAILQEIADTKILRKNWNGYGAQAPSERSRALAKRIVVCLAKRTSLRPLRVVPSAMGGLGILFSNRGRLADFEVLNDGVVVVGLQARGEPADAWSTATDDPDIVSSAERIASFLFR